MRIWCEEILTWGGTANSTVNSRDAESMRRITPGGADNKYRKLRGLGGYSRKSKDTVRSDDKGEYP